MPPERRGGGPPPEVTQERRPKTVEFDWKNGEIPRSEVEIKATRGGGPGGQAINTTSNNMEVRWNIGSSRSLSDEQKSLLRESAKSRVTKADELIFTCQSERSQRQNTDEALERLNAFIREALTPEAERVATTKSKGRIEKEKRLKQGDKKKKIARGRVNNWD